ncbi:MAG: glycosyltransferase [Lachnospiraceae bacterium]|nr:glycosyltransferase [Lachnospiraceae bacterium]
MRRNEGIPVKILMLNTKMSIGGAETHILALSRALKARGHTVTVGSAGGVYADELQKDGIGTVILPLDGRMKLLRAVPELRKLMKKENFDVIHAHGRLPAFAASLALKYNKCNIPLVTTAHLNFRTDPLLRKVTVWGERTLAVSPAVRDYLLTEYGISPDAVENTVNGVDTDLFRPGKPDEALLSALGLAGNGENRAIMVSRLDKNADAGVHTVLDALPEILKALPRFELILCGGGDDEEAIREKAYAVNRAAGRKAVLPIGPRTDIPALLKLASVGLGVSRAAMEEMACGKPVILIGPQGYLGIFDETKEKAAAGTNFCCMNALPEPKTVAEEIVKLFSLPQSERDRRGAENRRLIEREYSVGRMADDAERLYRFVVKSEP